MKGHTKCCIPFCEHTSSIYPVGQEFICRVHWRYVPRKVKALMRRVDERWLKNRTEKNAAAGRRMWQRCKEKAMGF